MGDLNQSLQAQLLCPQGTALAILNGCLDGNMTVDRLIELIEGDAALYGRLHDHASYLVGQENLAPSTSETVRRLGVRNVQQLAIGYSLIDQFVCGPCIGFDYGGFWSHSLLMGIALREIGAALALAEPDALFSAGFLARVGCLALASAHAEHYGKIIATGAKGKKLLQLEQKFLKTDHIALSRALFGHWGMGTNFVQALAFTEDLETAPNDITSLSSQIGQTMHLARKIADFSMLPNHEQIAGTSELIELANELGIDAMEMGQTMDTIHSIWQALGVKLELQTFKLPAFETLVAENLRPDREIHSSWLRVLIVDDEPIALSVVEEWLGKRCGYTVRVASNGADALALAESFLPHVVLTDWRMPVMDGLELCRALRSSDWGKSLYVIMLTSAELESELVEAFNAGVDDYINKPINLAALSARMKAAWRYVRLRDTWEQDNRRLSRLASELALINRRLQHFALTDPLTELANRRCGMDALKQAWGMSSRYAQPLTVVTNDIDHFKKVNDIYGHAAGDAVLQQFSRSLKSSARSEDTVCRWGGEEFLIVLPNVDLAGGKLAAERLRKIVEASSLSFENKEIRVTASFGVASWIPGLKSFEELIALADQALYAAKAAGRNCVKAIESGNN